MKKTRKLIFLIIPYTWNPSKSFFHANRIAAQLMKEGHVVFSPVSHGHKIADHLESHLRTDNDFWWEQNRPFLDACDEAHVVMIGSDNDAMKLLDGSKGSQQEIKYAKKAGKPIHYVYTHTSTTRKSK